MPPRHQVCRDDDKDNNNDNGQCAPRAVPDAAGVVLLTFVQIGIWKQGHTIKRITQTTTMRLVRLDAGFAEGGARRARTFSRRTARGQKEAGQQEGGHAPDGIRMQGLPQGRCVGRRGVGGRLVAALGTRRRRRPQRRAAGGEHKQGQRSATGT